LELFACSEGGAALLREIEGPRRLVLEVSGFAADLAGTSADLGRWALDHPVVRTLSHGL
jgi:hypothetical protein